MAYGGSGSHFPDKNSNDDNDNKMMVMMMMMMMITIKIQRRPTVFTMLGIFLAMQSLVKKTKAKKK